MNDGKQHIVSFSGGKDSTAMLLMMIKEGMRIDRIINVDTTKEFPQMYEHIEKVKDYIKPLKIETIKLDFDYWFSEKEIIKGKRKGQNGYGFPDFLSRWCTSLKQAALITAALNQQYDARKWYSVCDVENSVPHIGIAFDEVQRTKKKNNGCSFAVYPLVEWQITSQMALEYCYDLGFDWGGLYKKFSRLSCWCCPLQRISELRVLYNDFPGLWRELEKMQETSCHKFRQRKDVNYYAMRFARENQQPLLFSAEQ